MLKDLNVHNSVTTLVGLVPKRDQGAKVIRVIDSKQGFVYIIMYCLVNKTKGPKIKFQVVMN